MAHNHKGCSGCEELSEKLEKEKEEKHNSCKEALLLHQNKISGLEKKLFAMTIIKQICTITFSLISCVFLFVYQSNIIF